MNAMALIAPGAFLWLTFQEQSLYGAPMAGCAMWFGIVAALMLCFATAISYAELAKLDPASRTGARVCAAAREHGLLTRPILDTIVLMPPLCVTEAQVDQACEAVEKAVAAVLGR